MGAGRVGTTLAETLESRGHSVAIIDQNPDAFRRLPESFEGRRVTGMGFDRDALAQAGIEDAYAFAAVSSGDNSNIIAARVVRETFGVENVVARIYDPARAEIYQRLGITTVATVRWTADQVLRRMMPVGAASEFRDASGSITLCELDLDAGWLGRQVRDVQTATGARVAFLSRFGDGYIPTPEDVLQEQDVLHALVYTDALEETQRTLSRPPRPEED
ncbi:potassium channel family protein [Ruania alba]|uniref:Trk system potassium uptake protein TrkA n=1 Tax=Ruania alba TaxID=648782 RepID=A0A1H5FKE3_9MICO|nr:TrkA family potassium uptake protein [Ruania alba]SEE03883.1 trk system potassium uptake protein TrkA [Ruania alba]